MSHPPAEMHARRDALAIVYSAMPHSAWFTVLVAWACAYVLWPVAPAGGLVGWALLMTALSLARAAYARACCADPAFPLHLEHDTRVLAGWLLLTSVGFAAGFVLFALDAPAHEQFAFSLFVLVITAGATTVLTGCRAGFLAYCLPATLTIAAAMCWSGVAGDDSTRLFLGLMMLLYAVAISGYQRRLDRRLLESLRARHDQSLLLAEKDAQLARLNKHNEELSADRAEFLTASLTDGLTGLANRRHFDRTLARDWERHRREGIPLACILMDIDRFKHYNDIYGHMAGDDCLRVIAGIIAATVSRGGDFAARYGGEEFVVLLPGTDASGARLIAERVRDAVERQAIAHAGGGPGRVVTLSAGVSAVVPGQRHPSAQTLVDLADEALYAAKNRGRNRVAVRDPDDPVSLPDGYITDS